MHRLVRRCLLVACCALAIDARAQSTPILAGEKLTLDRAIALALANHPAKKAAEAEAGAAHERVGEAESAYLPQVYGVAEYLRATDNGIGDTAYLPAIGLSRAPTQGRHVDQLSDTFDNVVGSIAAFQHLFDFGRTRGLVEQRDAEADAQNAKARLVQLDLVFGVAKAFYDLVDARQIVAVYEKAVAQRDEHLHEAKVKAEAGLRPDIDTTTAEADLARAQLRLIDARNQSQIAKAALDDAMGLGESAPDYVQAEGFLDQPPEGTLLSYVASAMESRPDLQMLVADARAAGAVIRQGESDYLPTLGAVAGYNARGQETTPASNFFAGVVITWPIFNGFRTDHQVSEAKLHQTAIGHAIEDLRQRIGFQVKRSYLAWQAARERIRQAEKALAASRLQLDLAEKRYEKGLGSIIELTDAERQFTQDDADRVRALAEFSIDKAALDRDTGAGLPQGAA